MFSENVAFKFETIASQFSEHNAFCVNEVHYTYYEFWKLISKIRTGLRQLKLDDYKFGLVVNDDIETYASILAIWMEGYGYVPLHPKHPENRNLDIVNQAELSKILDSNINSIFKDSKVVNTSSFKSLELTTGVKKISDDATAYILFTSGSTGEPKGVPISFGNLDAFINSFLEVGFELDHSDKFLQCFDLTFDVSIQSFLIPLLFGACVYTVPHNQIKYSYVFGLLDDYELTFAVFAPSMIRLLRPYFDEINLKKLRYCILTAEASPVNLVKEWGLCIPNAKIFNFYGPTEATIYCTFYEVNLNRTIKDANGMLSIGRPFKALDTIILDDNLQIVDKGEKGELYVSGDQVTNGYWKDSKLNDEAFIMFNYNGDVIKFYKTGDLCLQDDDDHILYFGRLDHQVKIQGYRIELGEIEYHARKSVGGGNAVAFIYQTHSNSTEIALCFEAEQLDKNMILFFLRDRLPSYMIPSRIYNLKKFPLNTNDKVDKNQIKKEFNLLELL